MEHKNQRPDELIKKAPHAAILFAAMFALITFSVHAGKFQIAVFPDTQSEVCVGPGNTPTKLYAMAKWITNNMAASNIVFTVSVGDNVNWTTPDEYMWINASNAYRYFDLAGMPYALAIGNHDTHAVATNGGSARDPVNTRTLVRETPEFNAYFPVSRHPAQKGRFEAGKSDNAFYTFTAGGLNWMVMSLELWPRQVALDWAKTVIGSPAYANYNVIITTHSYLNSDGSVYQSGSYGELSPQAMYDQLVKQYANIRIVLCGHVDKSAWKTNTGVNGNRIYQILQDYQGENNGWVRFIEFDTTSNTIKGWMYSPYLNQGRSDGSGYTTANILFTNVNFVPGAAAPTVTGAPGSFTTNRTFSVTLDVDNDNGYWSTNGTSYTSFGTAGTTITIDRTLTLSFYGRDTNGRTSATNSVTYTFDTAAPTVTGAPNSFTTNAVFTVSLDVNENHGWYSTNGVTFYQFTTMATNILIDRTLTLSYYGRDVLGNTSATNSRTYTIDLPPVVSGAPSSCMTNRSFIIMLDVDKNHGYWSTNNSPFSQLSTAGVNMTVDRTTTLRYFGSNAAGVGTTNSRTYTFDTAAPVVTGALNDLSTNKVFSVALAVNENYGYVSLNGGAYVQFTSAGTNISITKTTTLSYFGRDALGNSSATNTRTYTVTIITGLENPSAVRGTDGFTFMNLPENTSGAVYSVSGRYVAPLSANTQGLFWDTQTVNGKRAAPGVYLCRLTSARDMKIVKVMVVR
ncbi:MAG: metallophosphoesterase [Spirochaetes bacterium]|nr:metallophosphoesterase [Spirochaetota bacterium]